MHQIQNKIFAGLHLRPLWGACSSPPDALAGGYWLAVPPQESLPRSCPVGPWASRTELPTFLQRVSIASTQSAVFAVMDSVCLSVRLIGSRILAFDWYQNHRHWMTLNGQNALWCRKDASFGAHCTNVNENRPILLATQMVSGDWRYKVHADICGGSCYIQCESKKVSPEVFWHCFPNGWEFLVQILHAYYTLLSTLDTNFYSIICNFD